MTNYTHLVRAVEKDYGVGNLIEHTDDPRIQEFRRMVDSTAHEITAHEIYKIQKFFDFGTQNITGIAHSADVSTGAVKNAILMNDVDIRKWKRNNKQFKQAQELLDKGRKDDIKKETGMSYSILKFFYKNNIFDKTKYLKNRKSVRLNYDSYKAQNLLDLGMDKAEIAKQLNITLDLLAREIRKGELSETNWFKWRLGIYKK
ncbi:hypothetical protein [Companilactobacillus metriopterae]|uniref:hypothetical protein n=1 Tax=Companilactobacillus metriopterae TaxID=1909267 RepID=UPI00100AB395|nr:hypothetical protein [Companilactobacillus metriopterae]